MSATCPCGNPLAWSDQGGMCADCRDQALLKTMRRRKPLTANEDDIAAATEWGHPVSPEIKPERKELSP